MSRLVLKRARAYGREGSGDSSSQNVPGIPRETSLHILGLVKRFYYVYDFYILEPEEKSHQQNSSPPPPPSASSWKDSPNLLPPGARGQGEQSTFLDL